MKKLTMTRVLTPLAALAFTLGAQAADYAKDDFEGTWSNSTGGYSFEAGPDSAADATAQYTYLTDAEADPKDKAPAAAISPIGGATNTKGLKLSTEDGVLFRNLTEARVGASGLYVDTDVQFTLTDKSDRPTPVTEGSDTDKFIIWLEADEDAGTTNLCVWAREYKLDNGEIVANSNKVYKLESGEIVPGTWHRLTVKAIAQSNSDTLPIPGFQVYLDNNQTPLASTEYFCPAADTTAEPTPFQDLLKDDTLFLAKTFFPAMSDGLDSLSKVGFSGEGKIDDFVVTDDIPSALPRVAVTVNWDSSIVSNVVVVANGGNKRLESSGSLLTLEPGSTASFTMANLVPMPGVNLSSYSFKPFGDDWELSGVANVTVAEGTVTVGGSISGDGAFTIALERSSSATVTLDWTGISDPIDNIASITYTLSGESPVTISDEEAIDQGTLAIPAELDQTITIAVTLADGVTGVATIAGTEGVSGSAPTFTVADNLATISIGLVQPVATVDGTPYTTFADAVAAAKTAGEPVVLCDGIALEAAVAIAALEELTIDLNGNTIVGADDVAAFTNAGTLTITDSSQDHDGSVVAGSDGYVVANTGTLSLEYGAYEGQFTNSGTFTITADCEFDNDLDGAYVAAAGYAIQETGSGTQVYKLAILTYHITYMNGDTELLGITPATYTVEDTVTLTNEVDLGAVGVSFEAWTNATGTVTGWAAGEMTGDQTFYAKTAAIVPPSGETIEPGQQSSTTYASQAEAEAALANVTIAASDAVTNALDAAAQATYIAKFEAKVVEAGEGEYKIEIGLTAAAEASLETVANDAVTTAASSLAAAASADQTVEVDAEPGFYYSVASGTEVGSLTEGARTLATGSKVNLTLPTKGAKGFYRVLINVAPSAQN